MGQEQSAKVGKLNPQGGHNSCVRKDVVFGCDLSLLLQREEDGSTGGYHMEGLVGTIWKYWWAPYGRTDCIGIWMQIACYATAVLA